MSMLIKKNVNKKQNNGYKCLWGKDKKGYKGWIDSKIIREVIMKKDGRKCYLI